MDLAREILATYLIVSSIFSEFDVSSTAAADQKAGNRPTKQAGLLPWDAQ